MKQLGTHIIVDAWQCPAEILNDPDCIRHALLDAIAAGGATLIDLCVHQFSPHGVTATATLAESHIAIHTWPEYGYFAADLFFCGCGEPDKAAEVLNIRLQAQQTRVKEFCRGMGLEPVVIPHPLVTDPESHLDSTVLSLENHISSF